MRLDTTLSWGGLTLALTLPWLMPFAIGPASTIMPMLFCGACLIPVLLYAPQHQVQPSLALFFSLVASAIMLSSPVWTPYLLLTLICIAVMAAMARVGAAAAQREEVLLALARAWLIAALLSSVIALLQYWNVAAMFHPWINTSDTPGTAFGNLRQRNHFASLTMLGLAALVWLLQKGDMRWKWAAIWGALLVAGTAASSSRTGLAQLCLLAGLAFLWRKSVSSQARYLLCGALAFFMLCTWLMPLTLHAPSPVVTLQPALTRLNVVREGCAGRWFLWRNVAELITQRPLLGWNWQDLAWAHYQADFAQRFCDTLDNAHNLPLHLAVELGVPLALLLCGFLLWLIVRARPWVERDSARQLGWSVLALLLLHSLLEYPLWYGPFQIAFALSLGLLWPTTTPHPSRNRWQCSALALLALLITYTSWDYFRITQIYLPPPKRAAAYQTDTLAKVQGSWLFNDAVRFANLNLTLVTPDNAPQMAAQARELMHYSPEPRVCAVLVYSLYVMGDPMQGFIENRKCALAFARP